jgi:hypothetical protein
MACNPRAVYSFVVDAHPRFQHQAKIITATLLAVGVSPDDIIAHVAPDVPAGTRAVVAAFGTRVVELRPSAIGGGVVNKIAQLQTLWSIEAKTYVLCDTDLAFMESLAGYTGGNMAWGRPVGFENPRLDQLEALRLRAGIRTTPRVVRTSCDERPTFATNCNGGVYILPRRVLLKLFLPWQEYTRLALMAGDVLGDRVANADQIGFALAMLYLEEDVAQLPVEWNFPAITVAGRFRHLSSIRPLVLHHHQPGDARGLLRATGHQLVDEAIARVNQQVMAFAAARHAQVNNS